MSCMLSLCSGLGLYFRFCSPICASSQQHHGSLDGLLTCAISPSIAGIPSKMSVEA